MQPVIALSPEQSIISTISDNRVIAPTRAAKERIITRAAVQVVVTAITGQRIVKGRAREVFNIRQGLCVFRAP